MVNNWNNPRNPNQRPNYYEGMGLDFAGQEQRFGWMLDDTDLAKDVQLIKQNLITGTVPLQVLTPSPILLSTTNAISQAIDCNELNILRIIVTMPTGLSQIGLQGYDGNAWFYFCNAPYTFIAQGVYTLVLNPIMAISFRVILLQANSEISLRILGK